MKEAELTQKMQEKQLISRSSSPSPTMNNNEKNGKDRCICLTVTAVILGLGLLVLILALTVFKARQPVIQVNSVAISNLDFAVNMIMLRVVLNVTLDVGISVQNPNRVGFTYTNSTAFLRYKGNDVGEAPLLPGNIDARETRALNLTLTLMADRLLSDTDLYSGIISGRLPFQTYIRIAGKVRILFNIHVVTYTTCDLEIDLRTQSISNQECHYRTNL